MSVPARRMASGTQRRPDPRLHFSGLETGKRESRRQRRARSSSGLTRISARLRTPCAFTDPRGAVFASCPRTRCCLIFKHALAVPRLGGRTRSDGRRRAEPSLSRRPAKTSRRARRARPWEPGGGPLGLARVGCLMAPSASLSCQRHRGSQRGGKRRCDLFTG